MKILPSETKLLGSSPCSLPDWGAHLIRDPITYLLETKWVQPRILGSRVEGSGSRRIEVVEVEVSRLRVDYYLDKTTRLPSKLVIKRSEETSRSDPHAETTITFDDYSSVDGIKMPGRITRESAPRPSLPARQIEHAQYDFNVEYDKSIFER